MQFKCNLSKITVLPKWKNRVNNVWFQQDFPLKQEFYSSEDLCKSKNYCNIIYMLCKMGLNINLKSYEQVENMMLDSTSKWLNVTSIASSGELWISQVQSK